MGAITSNKVWVITSGAYDSYGIDGVAETWEAAVEWLRRMDSHSCTWGQPERTYREPSDRVRSVKVFPADPRWEDAEPQVRIFALRPGEQYPRDGEDYYIEPYDLIVAGT